MKLIHLSDLHLGRSLCEFSLIDVQRAFLQDVLTYIDEHAVDAVMLCGEAQLLERTQRLWQRLRGERESGLARRVIDAAARRFAMTGRELARN